MGASFTTNILNSYFNVSSMPYQDSAGRWKLDLKGSQYSVVFDCGPASVPYTQDTGCQEARRNACASAQGYANGAAVGTYTQCSWANGADNDSDCVNVPARYCPSAQTFPISSGSFTPGVTNEIRAAYFLLKWQYNGDYPYFYIPVGGAGQVGAPSNTAPGGWKRAALASFYFTIPTIATWSSVNLTKNGDSISWNRGSYAAGTRMVYSGGRAPGFAEWPSRTYEFMWRKAGGNWQAAQEGGTSCTISGLEPCTTYQVAIRTWMAATTSAWSAYLGDISAEGSKLGFIAKSTDSGVWNYSNSNNAFGNILSIQTDCATPPVFGAYSASATGQTTGRFSWALTSPGDYCTYNSLKVYLKREIESDDAYKLIQTWGADTYGSGTLSGLVPGERYTVKFVARNSWGTRGYGLETTVYRTFRTQYPVGTYDGPYSNGEPGDTRWDYENVSTFDTSRWNMVVQMPNNTDNARLARVKGTIVGTNDASGRRDSISWSLFNRSTAEMTSTILNDLGLGSIPLTGSGTLYAPTGNDLVIDENTNVTSSIVLPGGNNGTNTGYIMNHRLWVKKSTDAWSSVKTANYSYRTNGDNKSVTWDLSQENYLPNTVYNLRSVVVNNVGMYTVTEANLYPPAYGGEHVITPIPTGTADEPRVEITSCVTNTGGLDDFDSADIKYHVFEGRAQNATEWTQFGRGGEGELCYKVETALPKLECNQNYIIRVTVYNKHGLSVRTEYVLTPPKDITISASTHNEIGIGYFKTNAVSSGSARIAKRETFWRKETDTEWLVSEIDYTVTTADVETRTPRVLEHETVYRGFVRMTNEYGLCANSTQVVWTTMPRYRLWDNIFRTGTIRAKQRPRVRNSAGTVLDSQNVYWIAADALSCQRPGFLIKDCKLRFPKGWHSGTQYECWRVTFEDGRYIAFENSTKGFNNYAYSSYGYYEEDGTLIAEFYNERDKWLMDEYVLPEECYVASFTAQYASGAERGVRQSSILNRTEVIGSWL